MEFLKKHLSWLALTLSPVVVLILCATILNQRITYTQISHDTYQRVGIVLGIMFALCVAVIFVSYRLSTMISRNQRKVELELEQ